VAAQNFAELRDHRAESALRSQTLRKNNRGLYCGPLFRRCTKPNHTIPKPSHTNHRPNPNNPRPIPNPNTTN